MSGDVFWLVLAGAGGVLTIVGWWWRGASLAAGAASPTDVTRDSTTPARRVVGDARLVWLWVTLLGGSLMLAGRSRGDSWSPAIALAVAGGLALASGVVAFAWTLSRSGQTPRTLLPRVAIGAAVLFGTLIASVALIAWWSDLGT